MEKFTPQFEEVQKTPDRILADKIAEVVGKAKETLGKKANINVDTNPFGIIFVISEGDRNNEKEAVIHIKKTSIARDSDKTEFKTEISSKTKEGIENATHVLNVLYENGLAELLALSDPEATVNEKITRLLK